GSRPARSNPGSNPRPPTRSSRARWTRGPAPSGGSGSNPPPPTRRTIALAARGDTVELRCVDRGPGIPEAARDLVFRPFQRLGDRDNTAGVGLGLALARGLVEAMGGTLTPEPTPGGG